MPIFDFECTKCSRTVERIVKYSEKNSQVCSCGNKMNRKVSAPGVVVPDPNHPAGFKARATGKYKLFNTPTE
jgi:putative FmdB family regulatory protein